MPMNPLELLAAALDLEPDARAGFLARECGDDASLRRRVDALLAAHARSGGFLEPPTLPSMPERVGPWRLLRQLGAGGMGVVWLAERSDGAFAQNAAIKLLPGRLVHPELVRRAEAERQFLAGLDHPNIARILDGGRTDEGQPWVAMEYVDGVAIDAYARALALDPRARVALFGQVLAAVDAAHRALIIHRDIKPANVLVTREGTAKLLDFGIAKSIDADAAATRTAALAFTPQYASPEQLSGQLLTTACDVYSLGLLLYELLTGRAAHDAEGLSLYELERWIATKPPTAPSTRVDAQALALAGRAVEDWRRHLDGDLDRVVLKALQPEPLLRYASAQAFADDLQRWLEHRPVLARSGGALYRAGKFLRRHRAASLAAIVAVVAVVGGTAVALHQGWHARQQAERAQRANDFLTGIIDYSDPRVSGEPVRLVDALDHATTQIATRLAGQPRLEGDIRHALGEAYLGQDRLDAAREQLALAATLRESDGGNDYAATLDVQAMLEWRAGDTTRAEALLRRALEACSDDRDGQRQRAAVLGDFAGLLGDLQRFDEALSLARESVRLAEALGDVPPGNLAASYNNLATSHYGLGEFDAAHDAFVRAGTLFESIQPPPELDLSINYNNRSVLMEKLGRLPEALPLAERSVALKRKVMGSDYPALVRPLSHLAGFYAAAGRHAEAKAAIDEALRLAPRLYPEGDVKIGDLYADAAELAMQRGDSDEAARAAESARRVFADADGSPAQRDRAGTLLRQAAEMPSLPR